jgi:hypothetical protein
LLQVDVLLNGFVLSPLPNSFLLSLDQFEKGVEGRW